LNNNRGNNRRRGRGNNNNRPQGGSGGSSGGGGGGQQVNRIDSRARGNAPQLLEKYRKLANDAHLNGDRVTAEYYLQFADHYFRVIADTRVRQEEARLRRDDRWEGGDQPFREETDDSGDFNVENDFPAFDQPVYQRREREDRPERPENGTRDTGNRDSGNRDSANREQGNREQVSRDPGNRDGNFNRDGNREGGRPRREDRPARVETPVEAAPAPLEETAAAPEPVEVNPFEPPENPFVRPGRSTRGLRPRREDNREGREPRRPRTDHAEPEASADSPESAPIGLDPATLPPAIGREPVDDAEPAATPRRRARRKPTAGDTDETLQSAG